MHGDRVLPRLQRADGLRAQYDSLVIASERFRGMNQCSVEENFDILVVMDLKNERLRQCLQPM